MTHQLLLIFFDDSKGEAADYSHGFIPVLWIPRGRETRMTVRSEGKKEVLRAVSHPGRAVDQHVLTNGVRFRGWIRQENIALVDQGQITDQVEVSLLRGNVQLVFAVDGVIVGLQCSLGR